MLFVVFVDDEFESVLGFSSSGTGLPVSGIGLPVSEESDELVSVVLDSVELFVGKVVFVASLTLSNLKVVYNYFVKSETE